MAHTEGRFARP